MRSLVVRREGAEASPRDEATAVARVGGLPVTFALTRSEAPAFDPDRADQRRHVRLKVRAFSLNFRDRALILAASRSPQPHDGFAVGSEFVAEVTDCGRDVTSLRPGDRVIPNTAYPASGVPGLMPGIPTNGASAEQLVLHEAKLMKIPAAVTDAAAAAFSIGAQTAYALVRRLALQEGEWVLLTAARSNTSLFALQALRGLPVRVVATTTSTRDHDALAAMGAAPLVQVSRDLESFADDAELAALARAVGGFPAVIDPYCDVHLPKVLDVMAFSGRYVTCGVYNQYLSVTGEAFTYRGKRGPDLLMGIVARNAQILGNCLGTTEDLARAMADHAEGRLQVTLDAVFRGAAALPAFLARTFEAPERFGKVVFAYD